MVFDIPDASPSGYLGPVLTAALLLLFFGLFAAMIGNAVRRAIREGRLARAAEAQGAQRAPLEAGPAVLFGKVQMAHDEAVAMRVEIDQAGKESESSGTYSFAWEEVDRRVEMRPFYLLLRSGERVRVEPDGRAFLVDAMDGMIVVKENARTRFAELSPNEQIHAVGLLRRGHDPEVAPTGYRGGGDGWVLRAEPDGELLLSSEPLEQRFRRRARAARWMALVATLFAAALAGVVSPYLARVALGEHASGTVLGAQRHKDEDSVSYRVDVQMDRFQLSLSCDEATYDRVDKVPKSVPVIFVRAWPSASLLGEENGMHAGDLAVGVVFLGLAAAALARIRSKSTAWYEGKLVDKGNGKLAEHGETVSSG
jgi:hypothetical protein